MFNPDSQRHRIAAVLETLARVLRSNAKLHNELARRIEWGIEDAADTDNLERAEFQALEAARLAGIEVAQDAKDGGA